MIEINLFTFFSGGKVNRPVYNKRATIILIILFSRFSIMSECWSEKPKERPKFKWIRTAVNRLIKDTKVETVISFLL